MKRKAQRGALYGALLGLGFVVLLTVLAVLRTSPGGPGENFMWWAVYTAIAGAPLSLVIEPVVLAAGGIIGAPWHYIVLGLAVPLNWATVGAVVGALAAGLRPSQPS